MAKYQRSKQYNPLKFHKLNIDRQAFEKIPNASTILEVGCATGFMGRCLKKQKNCKIFGVELGVEEAREARKVLDHVIVGDIEDKSTIAKIQKFGKFDVVFASALIEHLRDPWKSLAEWKKFLKRDGILILTTSNIAHWSQRINFIQGKFEYQEYGILDNTHLRFFTTKTFPKLVEDSGFIIKDFYLDPVGGGYPKISLIGSKFFPNLFTYQMGIVATT